MNTYKVLIFPAGSEIAFEINNALKYAKDIEVWGATSVPDHSEMVYSRLITGLPYIDTPEFIPAFNEELRAHGIDFIYPALDAAQTYLADHASELEATLVSSPAETVDICRSKTRTYAHLADLPFVPKTFAEPQEVDTFPVFVKPAVGQGSHGAEKIDTMQALEMKCAQGGMVICEYLSGDEYTIDCFTHKGEVAFANIRVRARTRTGISVRSQRIELTDEVMEMARAINERFDFRGAWFFQLKRNANGEFRLLEVSPRIPGTMAVSRNEGVNFPLLTIYELLGYDFELINNDLDIMLERAFVSRYRIDYDYDAAYVDFDDTITVRGKVNVRMMWLLYQLRNEGKEVYLLTRHAKDIHESLEKYAIAESLFTGIVHLEQDREKHEYIKHEKAIFIDDSFSERLRVKKALGIPVFDVDMVESLLNWKVD